jgi:putative ABC transport system permease protein
MRALLARLVEQWRRRRVERDFDAEIATHLEMLEEDGRRRGLAPAEARRQARLALGGLDATREAVRDRRGFRSLETLGQNLRYSVRLLARSPGFTAAAVVTLALGIGANTAIFSLVDAALLRPLPYAEPDRLVAIWELLGSGAAQQRTVVSPADYEDYRRARHSAGMAAYAALPATLTERGDPVRVIGEEVTASYFHVLGIPPAIGRPIVAADHEPGAPPVVVLSHGLWQERFGGADDAVGQFLTLNDLRYEIVGVMPRGFLGLAEYRQQQPIVFWLPQVFEPDVLTRRTEHLVHVVARLAPGASIPALRDELAGIARGFDGLPPGSWVDVGAAPLHEDLARDVRWLLLFLLAAVALVLLLACINVASLLIVRSLGRRQEIAVRFALGASRARVAGELVVQSLLLAALGAAAGWGLAVVLKDVIVGLAPMAIPRLNEVALDLRVLAFTALVTGATGLAFSVLPASRLARTRPVDALGSASRVISSRWALRSRTALVVVEVAVSTILVVAAGLMIRSLATMNGVDLGFRTENVMTANVPLPPARYPTPDARLMFFEDLASRVAAIPGVQSVAFANRLPLRSGWTSGLVIDPIDGPPPASMTRQSAGFQAVSPGYFPTLGLRLVRGRLLSDEDRNGSTPVAVVNEAFSPALLEGRDPIGRRIRRAPTMPAIAIVGVVSNIRRHGPRFPVEPEVYLPARQTALYPPSLSELAVRVDGDAGALAPALRAAIAAIDDRQPTGAIRTMDAMRAAGQATPRFQAFLLTTFATLALALAVVGIYGVVAFAVSQRRAEIGIRLALGAEPPRILRWMVAQSLRSVLIGAAIGIGAAALLARSLQAFLFEVSATDPLTYAGATLLLVLSALTASYLASRQAASVDPLTALK